MNQSFSGLFAPEAFPQACIRWNMLDSLETVNEYRQLGSTATHGRQVYADYIVLVYSTLVKI